MRPNAVVAGFLTIVAFAALAGISTGSNDIPASPAQSSPDCGDIVRKANGQPWRCTFADDFRGDALNPAKWGPSTTAMNNLRGSGDCWINSPDNVSVSRGQLHLTTRRMSEPFACTLADGSSFPSQVSSGSVSTRGLFAQAFGRWEIRARFPRVTEPGSHSALWLYPEELVYGPWPNSGEIDIAEFYSRYPDRIIPFLHYKSSSADTTMTNNNCLVGKPWEFHTYTAIWTPRRIAIAVDGRDCIDHVIHPAAPLSGPQPFDRRFAINLTQTLGIADNTATSATPFPLTTDIDYVRVWS